jgi:hypothetical protein
VRVGDEVAVDVRVGVEDGVTVGVALARTTVLSVGVGEALGVGDELAVPVDEGVGVFVGGGAAGRSIVRK